MVQVKDITSGNLWLWERGKFMNRRYMIQEMYQQFLDDDDSWKTCPKEKVKK
jgi:kinesin family protein 1